MNAESSGPDPAAARRDTDGTADAATDADTLQAIAEVARAHVGWKGDLSPEMRLVEDLRLDSLSLLTLAVEVENRFRVALDQEDEAGIETVGDLVRIVDRKLARAAV